MITMRTVTEVQIKRNDWAGVFEIHRWDSGSEYLLWHDVFKEIGGRDYAKSEAIRVYTKRNRIEAVDDEEVMKIFKKHYNVSHLFGVLEYNETNRNLKH